MKNLLGAIAILLFLVLLLGYLVLALTGHHKDNLGGPFMVVAAVSVLVLGVGLSEWWSGPSRDRSER